MDEICPNRDWSYVGALFIHADRTRSTSSRRATGESRVDFLERMVGIWHSLRGKG